MMKPFSFLTRQSLGEFLFLLFKSSGNCSNYPFCPYDFWRCSFFLPYALIKPLPKFFQTFQLGSAWISLDQLGSAWLSLAQLGSAWLSLAQLGSAWFSLAQLGSALLNLAQLGSAWLSLAQLGSALLCFCFTLFFEWSFKPQLGEF